MKNSDNFTISTNRVTAIVKSNSSVNVWIRVLKKQLNLLSYYYNYYLLWWRWYECIMICLRPPKGVLPPWTPRHPKRKQAANSYKNPSCRFSFFGFNKKTSLCRLDDFRMGGVGGRASSARSWILFFILNRLSPHNPFPSEIPPLWLFDPAYYYYIHNLCLSHSFYILSVLSITSYDYYVKRVSSLRPFSQTLLPELEFECRVFPPKPP